MRYWEQWLHNLFRHLPLPKVNINIYFSLWEKMRLGGGVGDQLPRNSIDPLL